MVKRKECLKDLVHLLCSILGNKARSESLLCSAGRVWSSRKMKIFNYKIKPSLSLGLENCAWPHEVPECMF